MEADASANSPLSLTFRLDDVRVQGSGLDLSVVSNPTALPTVNFRGKPVASGEIQLKGGSFEVVGKRFDVDRGLVRLRREEASNPYVNLTAHWDAPDGSRIYFDFVGNLRPVSKEKLRFRSEPARSEQAILALLLLGADTSDEAGSGSALVGNALFAGIAPLRGLSARVDRAEAGQLRTSVSYQFTDRLTGIASYENAPDAAPTANNEAPAPGGTANQRQGRTQVGADWRFAPNWALRPTFGWGGTAPFSSGLDVLWQYRY